MAASLNINYLVLQQWFIGVAFLSLQKAAWTCTLNIFRSTRALTGHLGSFDPSCPELKNLKQRQNTLHNFSLPREQYVSINIHASKTILHHTTIFPTSLLYCKVESQHTPRFLGEVTIDLARLSLLACDMRHQPLLLGSRLFLKTMQTRSNKPKRCEGMWSTICSNSNNITEANLNL